MRHRVEREFVQRLGLRRAVGEAGAGGEKNRFLANGRKRSRPCQRNAAAAASRAGILSRHRGVGAARASKFLNREKSRHAEDLETQRGNGCYAVHESKWPIGLGRSRRTVDHFANRFHTDGPSDFQSWQRTVRFGN